MTEQKERPILLTKAIKYLVVFFAGYTLCLVQSHCNYNSDILACDMPSFTAKEQMQ